MRQIEGLVDPSKERSFARGMVCPHAGLMYSGAVQGDAYSSIDPADTYVILGPNHHGNGADFAIMLEGVWEGPMGNVNVDKELATEIYKGSKNLTEDPFAHSSEHSLEIQLPFIQYFSENAHIVPIMMKHYLADSSFLATCQEIGNAIGDACKKFKHKVTIVASTDFSHYVPQEKAKKDDTAAMDAISKMDPKALFDEVRERPISMCGYGPVAAMLYACKRRGATKTRLIRYMNSGDITGDYSSVVGYASFIIE